MKKFWLFIEKWILLIVLPLVTFIIIICISIYLINYYNHNNLICSFPPNFSIDEHSIQKKKHYLSPNEIGDSIGGTMSPIIGFMGIVLTFLAFYIQYKANKQVQEQFKIQQFENHFFEMLKIHNDNVRNLNYKDNNGESCFKLLVEELKLSIKQKEDYNKPYQAYELFWEGGPLPTIEQKESLLNELLNLPNMSLKGENKNLLLSKYYRNLFNICDFVINQNNDIFQKEEKKTKYLRVLRTQLSTNEQILLFYNWLCGVPYMKFGYRWEEAEILEIEGKIIVNYSKEKPNKFLTEYRMIRNLFEEMLFDEYSKNVYQAIKEQNKGGDQEVFEGNSYKKPKINYDEGSTSINATIDDEIVCCLEFKKTGELEWEISKLDDIKNNRYIDLGIEKELFEELFKITNKEHGLRKYKIEKHNFTKDIILEKLGFKLYDSKWIIEKQNINIPVGRI